MAGRPLKFQSVEELKVKIDAYFESCDNRTTTIVKDGNVIEIPDPRPYTITGLALALNTSRETLLNYQNKEEYFDTIRAAKDKCEAFAEESLWKPKVTQGVIFNLKNNYGWIDKQEVDNNVKAEIDNKMNLSGLSVDDIKELLNK